MSKFLILDFCLNLFLDLCQGAKYFGFRVKNVQGIKRPLRAGRGKGGVRPSYALYTCNVIRKVAVIGSIRHKLRNTM